MLTRLIDAAPEEGPALRAEHRRRKRRMYHLAAAVLPWCVLAVTVTAYVWEPAGWPWLAGVLAYFAMHHRTWRCPRRGTGFGRRRWVDVCPGCRLVLEAEGSDASEKDARG